MYLKNRIIIFFYFFISFCLLFFSFHFPSIFFISVRFVLVDFVLLSLVSFHFVFISLISFRFVDFVSFLLISFRFRWFRFVSFLFRFALYRYPCINTNILTSIYPNFNLSICWTVSNLMWYCIVHYFQTSNCILSLSFHWDIGIAMTKIWK